MSSDYNGHCWYCDSAIFSSNGQYAILYYYEFEKNNASILKVLHKSCYRKAIGKEYCRTVDGKNIPTKKECLSCSKELVTFSYMPLLTQAKDSSLNYVSWFSGRGKKTRQPLNFCIDCLEGLMCMSMQDIINCVSLKGSHVKIKDTLKAICPRCNELHEVNYRNHSNSIMGVYCINNNNTIYTVGMHGKLFTTSDPSTIIPQKQEMS